MNACKRARGALVIHNSGNLSRRSLEEENNTAKRASRPNRGAYARAQRDITARIRRFRTDDREREMRDTAASSAERDARNASVGERTTDQNERDCRRSSERARVVAIIDLRASNVVDPRECPVRKLPKALSPIRSSKKRDTFVSPCRGQLIATYLFI